MYLFSFSMDWVSSFQCHVAPSILCIAFIDDGIHTCRELHRSTQDCTKRSSACFEYADWQQRVSKAVIPCSTIALSRRKYFNKICDSINYAFSFATCVVLSSSLVLSTSNGKWC